MRITILGAGPAGLYAAILIRRLNPDARIRLFEQNAADAAFGFGVVFSDQALAFLRDDDPETADLIEPSMTRWSDIHIVHRGERMVIDGIGFSGIGRLELLRLLQQRAAELGILPSYETRITDISALEADLLIGADGLNSTVRASGRFDEQISALQNRFIWYGTDRAFDALTQTFIDTQYGPMNAHHYAYAPGKSTFIIEMGAETFDRTGFANLAEPDYRQACERLFDQTLEGAGLVPNNSTWRRFPNLSCGRWFDGNRTLVGDALHTAHFSIGSGTRLALEDVISLVHALRASDWNVATALPLYQSTRQPVLEKIVAAASRSADWYEAFGAHMTADPLPFSLSYIRRAGRLDASRLRALAPHFASQLEASGLSLEDAA
ncbi:FAD-dependent monooxygenase [Thalassococcus sp. S3]|uniref:FAD-dependent monooxygenase n=1 Tax=Thalassococcus sp. S3 TaxID=2017482 RepID=UPI0010241EF0|nr:FAD-dependent monooxygenase [Thalassococcus sp. S3]QBF31095.1 monooxygenase [Thalassococcus sp. S3]